VKPVRQAAADVRRALDGLAPVPAEPDIGLPARWFVTGIAGDGDIRTITAEDLATVLRGTAT
jgi:hypothetical protein